MNYYAKKLCNTAKPLLGLSFTTLNYDIQKKKQKEKIFLLCLVTYEKQKKMAELHS